MKLASVIVFSLVVAPCALLAQFTRQPSSGAFRIGGPEQGEGGQAASYTVNPPHFCPVGLSARHLPDGDLVKTGFAHPKGVGQALHLTLSGETHGPITEATILFRGFLPKGHSAQAASESNSSATRSQLVRFNASTDPTDKGKNASTADIWVAGLSAVTSIEVLSTKSADGSVWTPSGDFSCRITPDLFMPVQR
jgi:hypothetical protein